MKAYLIPFVLLLLTACIILTCCTKETENDEITANNTTESTSDNANESKDSIVVGEILDCIDYVGKSISELDIPKSVVTEEILGCKTYLDGTVLGETDYAILRFDSEKYTEDMKAKSMWIHVTTNYDKICDELTSRYGEPIGEGEEPYVSADGGAVIWCRFETDNYNIKLSSASERTYSEIRVDIKD